MPEDKFLNLYRQLNAEQREAVDVVEGPVMVVAGPGTGKTQILTLRIANILRRTDTSPRNILALTFTESAASSMRRRLADIIGSPAYAVTISTFHGFCNEVIKNYPEEFPRLIGSRSITEIEQSRILQKLIDKLSLKILKPFGDPGYYARSILQNINLLKREGLTPVQFKKIVADEARDFQRLSRVGRQKEGEVKKAPYSKGELLRREKALRKNEDLAKLYAAYQKHLFAERLYDYNDMIMEVLAALRANKDLLLQLQEAFQYILVDEHQDTNNAQNKILELLGNFQANPNIFVVGDDKQAIFRFQGASLQNFAYFRQLYPEARIITLTENYRSSQTILDSARHILAGPKELKARGGQPERPIKFYEFSRPDIENYFIARDIRQKLKQGVRPEDVVVLYRDNRDAFPIAAALEKLGLNVAILSDQDVLADPEIRKLVALLRAVARFGSDEHLLPALHLDFLNLEPLAIYKLIAAAHQRRQSIFDVWRSPSVLRLVLGERGSDPPELQRLTAFYRQLASWAKTGRNKSLPSFLEILARESGFLDHLFKGGDLLEAMDKLAGLLDEAQAFLESRRDAGLVDFVGHLDALTEQNMLIKRRGFSDLTGRVRLMTVHKAKGAEFEYVYLANVFDGHWGNRRRAEILPLPSSIYSLTDKAFQPEAEDGDERRLFYVALTRAKKEIIATYAKESLDGRLRLPASFFSEINVELVSRPSTAEIEAEFAATKPKLLAVPATTAKDWRDKKFIKKLFEENGFSVTALNNYLTCPWQYFYTNLLRVPKAPSRHQMYGIAVHSALKDFFDALRDGSGATVGKKILLDKFVYYLQRQPLAESEYEASLAKGVKALSGYAATCLANQRPALAELNISGVLLGGGLRLTGKIDKLEFLSDGGEVNVVDYKTSQPKTRGEIEGHTKNSTGDIKRQLVFYNLLLNHYENRRYKMISGQIDFIEPDERGRYHQEKFFITPAEIVELEKLIRRTAKEILSLSFWDRRCADSQCEYCRLREMMG